MEKRDLPILLLLILAPPIGVALMYRRGLFTERTRLTVAFATTALCIAAFMAVIAIAQALPPKLPAVYMLPPDPTQAVTPSPALTPAVTPTPTPSPTPTAEPTPSPSPTPEPIATQNPADIVHITPSGKRYHEEDCSTLARSKNITALSRQDAEARGLTPCQVCTP